MDKRTIERLLWPLQSCSSLTYPVACCVIFSLNAAFTSGCGVVWLYSFAYPAAEQRLHKTQSTFPLLLGPSTPLEQNATPTNTSHKERKHPDARASSPTPPESKISQHFSHIILDVVRHRRHEVDVRVQNRASKHTCSLFQEASPNPRTFGSRKEEP